MAENATLSEERERCLEDLKALPRRTLAALGATRRTAPALLVRINRARRDLRAEVRRHHYTRTRLLTMIDDSFVSAGMEQALAQMESYAQSREAVEEDA
jgi:hypothetical protein